jgi:glycosyltransferase involved in cell wall biosynthesis
MPRAAFVSFRLGAADGVSVVAAAWRQSFARLGWETWTVGGGGVVDSLVPWLTVEPSAPPAPPDPVDVKEAVDGANLVVVENVLTIPVNLAASRAVAEALRGRAALLHHHDPPWQRPRFAKITELPVGDPSWRHVVVNHHTREELAARGLAATTIYNGFDLDPPAAERARTRARLGIADGEILLLHPVRAIERKDIPGALALAEVLGATYWLTGPAEEGYGPTLARLLAGARTRVLRLPLDPAAPGGVRADDAYAACDAVLLPSTWEGFGNPAIEAAPHLKPVVVGHYPASEELRALGFAWLDPDDAAGLAAAIAHPDHDALARNLELARTHCSTATVDRALADLLAEPGWIR